MPSFKGDASNAGFQMQYSDTKWQPLASAGILRKRAEILRKIRTFFEQRSVLEVDVPIIGSRGVTDPYLEALTLDLNGQEHYLQTSPEYFMKRMLAAGSGDIYYLGKAFRKDESGRIHHPEFTMLEWYRLGFDDARLIEEVMSLVCFLKPSIEIHQYRYETLFQRYLAINPHRCSANDLQKLASEKLDLSWRDSDKSVWLDVLFSHFVEPKLTDGLYVVSDYPECQSALAKTGRSESGDLVAKRFECFLNGVELANGYWELSDLQEHQRRFDSDNKIRSQKQLPAMAIDENLMAAMHHGLPECAGVALGVDRLIMALLDLPSIADQRSF